MHRSAQLQTASLEKIRVLEEELVRQRNTIEAMPQPPIDVLRALDGVIDALTDLHVAERGTVDEEWVDAATKAVEEALPLTGAEAMSSVLAQMGEAAEYTVPDTLSQIQTELDALDDPSADPEERQPSKRRDPGQEESPPPEEMKPSDEPSEDAEKGDGDEDVLARAETQGQGEEQEGDGTVPEELQDDVAVGAGTVQMEGAMGEESAALSPQMQRGTRRG